MTLIIYAKCIDGVILISDRQASGEGGDKKFVNKIYSPSDKKFILSLAGDGLRIEQVYSAFETNPSLKDGDIKHIVKSIIDSSFMTNSDGNVEGILLIKNEATYVPFKVFSRRHITTILSLQNPFECFGLSLAINASKFILQYGDIENKNLEKATDFLISIMDMISKNYDGIGTLSDGFDIVSISENGDIFECPCLKKHDGKITINAEPSSKKVLSSFLTIQNKSETKQKQVKKLASTKTLEKIPTTIPKIVQPTDMMNIPVSSHLFAVPPFQSSKCTICGKPLTPVESIFSKCSECSLKDSLQTHGIFAVPLFQNSKCSICNKPLTPVESISSKCSECSLKDSLQTHGIFAVPLFQNSKCSICNKPLTPVESISSKCSECSLKDSLQTHGIFDVPLFQSSKCTNMW